MKFLSTLFTILLVSNLALGNNSIILNTFQQNQDNSDSLFFTGLKGSYCPDEKIKFVLNLSANIPQETKFILKIISRPYGFAVISPIYILDTISGYNQEISLENYDISGKCYFEIESLDKKFHAESPFFYVGELKLILASTISSTDICQENLTVTIKAFQETNTGGQLNRYGIFKKNGIDISAPETSEITVNENGNYTFETNDFGCIYKAKLNNYPKIQKPIIQAANYIYTTCNGGSIQLRYSNNTNIPFAKFDWLFNNTSLEINASTLSAKKTGYYQLVGFKDDCVFISDSLFININTSIENHIEATSNFGLETIKGAIHICNADFVNFSSSEANHFLAQNGGNNAETNNVLRSIWQKDGIDLPNSDGFYLKKNEEGTYRLKIQQNECFSYSNEIKVTKSDIFKPILKLIVNEYAGLKKIHLSTNEEIYLKSDVWYPPFNTWKTELYKNGVKTKVYSNTTDYISLGESGVYYLKFFDSQLIGCTAISDTFQITKDSSNKILKTDTVSLCSTTYLKIPNLLFNTRYISRVNKWFFEGNLISNKSLINISKPGLYTLESFDEFGSKITKQYFVKDILNFSLKDKLSIAGSKGKFEICDGEMLILFPNSSLIFDKYDIFKDEKLIKENQTGIFLNESGKYYVKTKYKGCEATSDSIDLNVIKPNSNSIFPIEDSLNICKGGFQDLTVNNLDNNSINWFFYYLPLENELSTYRARSQGKYYATIDNGKCIFKTKDKWILENKNLPTATISGDTIVNLDDNATLKINFTSSPPFDFIVNGNIEGNSEKSYTEISVKPQASTEYKITSIKNTCGEGTALGTTKIIVLVLGIENPENSILQVYPNPSSDYCIISFENLSNKSVKVVLTNNNGQILLTKDYQSQINDQIDFKDLPSGTYFLNLQAGNESFSRKIIKQ